MNLRVMGIAIVVMVLAIGGAMFLFMQPRTAVTPAREAVDAKPSASESVSAPEPTTPPPATRPEGTPRPTRRPSTSAPAAPTPAVEAPAELGTLRIESDVPNAQVFLDRQFVGTAPVTAENVKPGTHTLNVSAEGFEGIVRTLDVEPGPRDVAIRFREVRLNATLAVVHKHRMGNCTGQLVASAQGIRYDTPDKDDRFAATLNELETFVVDYQDKNLKIKLRKGKQYNFTDPDGNADRLFVFQRDVDKARQRLVKGDAPASN
jgi:hypothetical protein